MRPYAPRGKPGEGEGTRSLAYHKRIAQRNHPVLAELKYRRDAAFIAKLAKYATDEELDRLATLSNVADTKERCMGYSPLQRELYTLGAKYEWAQCYLPLPKLNVVCAACGGDFKADRVTRRFCSAACRQASFRQRRHNHPV